MSDQRLCFGQMIFRHADSDGADEGANGCELLVLHEERSPFGLEERLDHNDVRLVPCFNQLNKWHPFPFRA